MDHAPQVDAEDPLPVAERVLPCRRRAATRRRCCTRRARRRGRDRRAGREALDVCCLETSTFSVSALHAFRFAPAQRMSLTSATSPSATFMPSSAKASAIARPSPLAAPVTTATLPLRSFMALSSECVPEHRAAADQDQDFHEQDVQLRAHARDQPRRESRCRECSPAPITTPVKKASVLSRSKRWNSAALQMSRMMVIMRVGGEHRRGGEARAEQQRNQDHAGAGGDAGGEAEHARAGRDAHRAERHLLRVEHPAHRHRGDHHHAEHDAEHACVEHAVDPGAEHEERQRARRAPGRACAGRGGGGRTRNGRR